MSIRNYGLIRTAAEFLTHARRIMAEETHVGFDIESGYTGPDREGISLLPHHPDWIMVGFSFTNGPDWARYVPLRHDNGDNVDNVTATLRILWRLLWSTKVVPHNANFELAGVARTFMEVLGNDPLVGADVTLNQGFFPIYSDSMIEAKMLSRYDPLRVGAGLKGLSKHVLGQEMTEFKNLFPVEDTDMGPGTPKGKQKYIRFNTRFPDSPAIVNYTCEDSTAAWELSNKHLPEIRELEMNLMYGVEMRLLPILVEMENEGLVLDWQLIDEKADELARFRDLYNEQIQQDFARRTGRSTPVLLTSPKQLSDVLFLPVEQGGLGLPVKKRSEKTGVPSTADDALAVIAQKDQIIRDILTYRRVAKLYGSYLDKYRKQLNYAGNGRAYPNHNQIGAGTGRMSVDGVPYQQWPKPYHFELKDGTTFDLNFRDLLISPQDFRIVGFDYSQIELRVLAGQAGEETMIQAFVNDIDIHRATASTMLRIALEEVTKIERAMGKTINFGIVYGQGPEALAEGISAAGQPTTKEQADALLDDYFKGFPKLRAYMDGLVRAGSEQGYVNTPFGRRFTVWEYQDPRPFVRSKGDRLCVNAPIQGGAADYMKIAMVRAQNAIKKAGLRDKIRLVMSVHDALEFYVHKSVSTQETIDLLDPMVAFDHPALGGVPIRADWHEGLKWGHVVEVKRNSQTGVIESYVNEDDDRYFDTPEEAYARGLELDALKMEKYRKAIEARLAAQAEQAAQEQAAPEEDSADDLGRLFEKHGVDVEMQALIRAALQPDADTPDEEVKIEMSRLGLYGDAPAPAADDDIFADIDALLVEPVQDEGESIPGPSEPAPHPGPPSNPKPGEEKDDTPMALAEFDAAAEQWADHTLADENAKPEHRMAAEKTQISLRLKHEGVDRNQLLQPYYDRYHAEALPGENPAQWMTRVGVTEAEAVDPEDVPEWAHTDRPDPAAEVPTDRWLLVLDDAPDEDTFEVALKWLAKIGTETYVGSPLFLRTPEGEVPIGTYGLGIKVQPSMQKIERLLGGRFIEGAEVMA